MATRKVFLPELKVFCKSLPSDDGVAMEQKRTQILPRFGFDENASNESDQNIRLYMPISLVKCLEACGDTFQLGRFSGVRIGGSPSGCA
jgi:hypothetical protein